MQNIRCSNHSPACFEPSRWNVLKLLERFGLGPYSSPPKMQRTAVWELPDPYHTLLVHSDDMTPTLEGHFRERAGLQVLRRLQEKTLCCREVVLTTPSHKAVEYGIIQIHLDSFLPALQEQILEEKLPLSRLLQEHDIPHLCWPQGFYSFEPNSYLQAALGLEQTTKLYGRRNVMLNGNRQMLADVLEILSPQVERVPTAKGRAQALVSDSSDTESKVSCPPRHPAPL